MAVKTVRLRALGRIDYNGGSYCPGTDSDTFDCDQKEAKRLIEDGVAVAVLAAVQESKSNEQQLKHEEEAALLEAKKQEEAALLKRITEAASEEDLAALMPEQEPVDAEFAAQLSAAAEARLAELRG